MKRLKNFQKFALSAEKSNSVRGGAVGFGDCDPAALASCRAAAPYACETGGYTVGSIGFANCMQDIYVDCEAMYGC